jgi:hypothetical protein
MSDFIAFTVCWKEFLADFARGLFHNIREGFEIL